MSVKVQREIQIGRMYLKYFYCNLYELKEKVLRTNVESTRLADELVSVVADEAIANHVAQKVQFQNVRGRCIASQGVLSKHVVLNLGSPEKSRSFPGRRTLSPLTKLSFERRRRFQRVAIIRASHE
jgi:hypothetical protein